MLEWSNHSAVLGKNGNCCFKMKPIETLECLKTGIMPSSSIIKCFY